MHKRDCRDAAERPVQRGTQLGYKTKVGLEGMLAGLMKTEARKMTATTYGRRDSRDPGEAFAGFATSFLTQLITSRERTASKRLGVYLASFDDATLTELGYSKAEIELIRDGHEVQKPPRY